MAVVTETLTIANTEALDYYDNVTYMGFGSGTTTPNEADTTLQNELGRFILESSTKDISNKKYTFVGRIPLPQLNGVDINELGLFDASSGGTMFCRISTSATYTKTSDDELLFTLIIQVDSING